MASPYGAPETAPVAYTITINSSGDATSAPTVKAGDTVTWTASTAAVFVDPPSIFSPQPSSPIDIAANASAGPYRVNGSPATYNYTSGLQDDRAPADGNDSITIST